jgi:uncharacterized protein
MNLETINKIAHKLMSQKRNQEWRDVGNKYYHGQRVAKLAVALRKLILPNENGFDEILTVASWLHDVRNDDNAFLNGVNIHGKLGAEEATEILKPYCDATQIELIANLIEHHDDRNSKAPHGDLIKILQDADLLDHRGTTEIWGTIVYASIYNRTMHETAAWNMQEGISAIKEYRERLNFEISKKIFDDRTNFYKTFVERFFAESNGEIFN